MCQVDFVDYFMALANDVRDYCKIVVEDRSMNNINPNPFIARQRDEKIQGKIYNSKLRMF